MSSPIFDVVVEYLIENKWSYRGHPVDVCTMHHNSNPKSCELVGGTWFDTMDRSAIGCYYTTRAAGIRELSGIFVSSGSMRVLMLHMLVVLIDVSVTARRSEMKR